MIEPEKDNQNKSRVDLIDAETLLEIWEVLRIWAEKYTEWSWKWVPVKDYIWACLRHIYKYQTWEELDNESWQPHIIHAITNLIFINHNRKHNHENIEENNKKDI